MVTVDKVRKSWKNAVLAKCTTNYWLRYDRSDEHATNFIVYFKDSTNIYW